MPYSASELRDLKEMIEGMSHHHQIEVLRILHDKNNGSLNENQNGTYVTVAPCSWISVTTTLGR